MFEAVARPAIPVRSGLLTHAQCAIARAAIGGMTTLLPNRPQRRRIRTLHQGLSRNDGSLLAAALDRSRACARSGVVQCKAVAAATQAVSQLGSCKRPPARLPSQHCIFGRRVERLRADPLLLPAVWPGRSRRPVPGQCPTPPTVRPLRKRGGHHRRQDVQERPHHRAQTRGRRPPGAFAKGEARARAEAGKRVKLLVALDRMRLGPRVGERRRMAERVGRGNRTPSPSQNRT